MEAMLLMLARNELRSTMVLIGIVVVVVAALIRKKRRVARRLRSDKEDAAALRVRMLDHPDMTRGH